LAGHRKNFVKINEFAALVQIFGAISSPAMLGMTKYV
jgi:hypothetical protein